MGFQYVKRLCLPANFVLLLLIIALITSCVPTETVTAPAVSDETEGTPIPCPDPVDATRVVVEVVTLDKESEQSPPSSTPTPTRELQVMDMATMMARPPYITVVHPEEYSMIPLSVYQEGPPDCVIQFGGGTAKEGFRSNLCVSLDLEPLVQPGDDLVYPEVPSRMTLLVDGKPMEWGNYVVHALLAERIEPDGTRTYWSPPHTPCWLVPVGLGQHEATFQFRQTSGDIQTYNWHFEIVE